MIYWDLLLGTEEVAEELERLYSQMSIAQLAEHLGVSHSALRRKLVSCGIKLRSRGGAHFRIQREDLPDNIADMSIAQIVEITGYTANYAKKLKYKLLRKEQHAIQTGKILPEQKDRDSNTTDRSKPNGPPRK